MSTVDFAAELVKAGAHAQGGVARVRFLARRYPLGAAGAAIMALFVFAAAFADFLTLYDPLSTNSAVSLMPPGREYWLGTDELPQSIEPGDMIEIEISGIGVLRNRVVAGP